MTNHAATTVSATNLCWEITSRCNDRCAFCYRPAVSHELSLGQAEAVLDRLVRGGIRKITWTGGEALLYPHTERLIRRAREAGVITSLITNCILLTSERARCLATHLDWITFSLDGPDPQTQAAMTRNSRHFERITGWLDRFQNEFPQVHRKINTVAAAPNVHAIPDMARLMERFGISRWKIFRFFPVRGCALENCDRFNLDDDDMRGLSGRMDTVRNAIPGCRVDVENVTEMNDAYLSLLPDGTLRVSHDNRDTVLGSLLTDGLTDLLAGSGQVFSGEKHRRRTRWMYQTAGVGA